MLYAEFRPARAGRSARLFVFSTTDGSTELHRFRCIVRAPRAALQEGTRRHLILFGPPMMAAKNFLGAAHVFDTLLDRVTWEQSQPDVMKLHPQPFLGDTL